MSAKMMVGWAIKCPCCEGFMTTSDGNGEEFVMVFHSKVMAQLRASEYEESLSVIEVELSVKKNK